MNQARQNRQYVQAHTQAPPSRSQPPPPIEPAAPGTVAAQLEAAEGSRQHLADRPEWGAPAHLEVAHMRARMFDACDVKHGRRPSMNPFEYSDPAVIAALGALEDLESGYIRAASAADASPGYVADARAAFGAALLRFANTATRGWPDRAEHERRQRAHARTW